MIMDKKTSKIINTLFKPEVKPDGKKVNISKVFVNKRNGQMTIILPKRKMKCVPKKVQITYW
jgi:hypothetical protein